MEWLGELRRKPWWIITASVSGLLVLLASVGLVGLAINQRVRSVTERALEYDVRLEDVGDDLRVAVLDVRHYHRNIVFGGPSRTGLADFEHAYQQLLAQIDELDELGVVDPRLLPPDRLRDMAAAYYVQLTPAFELYRVDEPAFTRASDAALMQLAELEQAARDIDHLGEQRAASALASVRQANASAQLVLLTVLGGLGLVGVGLGALVVRVVREQHDASRKLAQALQAKTDFIADASHELRTPLTVLRGNAEVALELERTCVHTEFLEEIVRESERMTHMVEDLLLLARSDSGSLPLQIETIEVAPFMADVAERAGILARERGATFRAGLRSEGWVGIDPARIEQVIMILVDNAAKFSPAGAPVTLEARTTSKELLIEVADRGPGIPAKDLPFVFERFYRVDKARARSQGGAGLGLAIAKTLVEAHGGRIEAESAPGAGTRMKIRLPVVARETASLRTQPQVTTGKAP